MDVDVVVVVVVVVLVVVDVDVAALTAISSDSHLQAEFQYTHKCGVGAAVSRYIRPSSNVLPSVAAVGGVSDATNGPINLVRLLVGCAIGTSY